MRWCLACKRFSGDGPICSSCGRSFGGRLCHGKKRHLSPPDAKFCNQCGSTNLLEAASYVPLGWLSRLLTWGGLLMMLLWVVLPLMRWMGGTFKIGAGFRSPLVWLIESCASLLILVFLFYFLSALVPGETGKMLRGFINNLANQVLKFGFSLLHKGTTVVFKQLVHWIGGTKTKP